MIPCLLIGSRTSYFLHFKLYVVLVFLDTKGYVVVVVVVVVV